MKKHQGLALVIVLWVLSLLTIMAGSFTLSMRRESAIISSLKNNARAGAVANSGLAIAEQMLLNPDPSKAWHTDGSIYEIGSSDAKVRIQLFSEAGKIDLNTANLTALQALMSKAPAMNKDSASLETLDRAAAIIDWRDQDDLLTINGAEKPQYETAGLNYAPANKSLQAFEELQLVLGLNAATLKWLEPLVTVYSGQAEVNMQLASKEVLMILPGIDTQLVTPYIQSRIDNARNNLPPPPLPIANAAPVAAGTPVDAVITVISEAKLDDGSTAVVTAVIKKADGSQSNPFQILKIRQTSPNGGSLFTSTMNNVVIKQYAESEFNH